MLKSLALSALIVALPLSAVASPYGIRLTFDDDPATTVAISWNSDDPSDRFVVYGTSPDGLSETVTAAEIHDLGGTLETSFSARLSGLQPATTYFYKVGNPGASFYPGAEPYRFRTLPADPCAPFRLVVIGDNRSDFDGIGPSALWPGILAEAVAEQPDLFLNTGDMVKNGDDPEEWRNFLIDSEVGLARVPSILTMGNHDGDDVSGDEAIYNRLFALPRNSRTEQEDYYSLDVGPLHVVSLSTQFVRPGTQAFTDMLAWLDEDLAASGQPWTVVFFHKAVYTKGNHSTGEEHDGAINANFVPIFDRHQVDLVLNGHSHNYERYVPTQGVDETFGGDGRLFPAGDRDAFRNRAAAVPDGSTGTTYLVTGGAGALTAAVGGFTCEDSVCTWCTGFNLNCEQDVFDLDQEGYVVFAGEHNFVVIDVEAGQLTVRAHATETGNASGGFTIDRFTMVSSDFDDSACGAELDGSADAGNLGGTADAGLSDLTTDDSGAENDLSADPTTDTGATTDVRLERDRGSAETGSGNAGGSASADDGCGCSPSSSNALPALWLAILALAAPWRRRRIGAEYPARRQRMM